MLLGVFRKMLIGILVTLLFPGFILAQGRFLYLFKSLLVYNLIGLKILC